MKFFPLFLQLAVSLGDYWDEGRCLNETESTETVFMQMLKREKVLSTKEYAEAMQCNQQQDSFKLNGGDFVFVLSPSAGVLWGDLMASWQKGPQNQRYIAVDYTFMSKSYQINDYTALSLDAGLGLNDPLTTTNNDVNDVVFSALGLGLPLLLLRCDNAAHDALVARNQHAHSSLALCDWLQFLLGCGWRIYCLPLAVGALPKQGL